VQGMGTVQKYLVLTKPNVWWLIVYVGVVGFLAGSRQGVSIQELVTLVAVLSSGSAGAETIANYVERDLDARMERTRRRPLPSGAISPPEKALLLGLLLTAASLVLSSRLLSPIATAALILGIIDYVVVYVILTKRRTAWNIIAGSPAGAAPVIVGYAASSGVVDATAILLALLIVIWIPSHVWSLALRYREDYISAGVPMLTSVIPEKDAVRTLAASTLTLVATSLALPLVDARFLGWAYMGSACVLGVALIALSLNVLRRPNSLRAWALFKFTSPYLAVIYSAALIELLF